MSDFSVKLADWPADHAAILSVRRTVFIEEQKVSESLEVDGLDSGCLHVLAEDSAGNSIGTGRLMPEGRIGRLAVLEFWRKRGVGAALMRQLIAEAERLGQADGVLHLHAQSWTTGFYEKLGFVISGDEFDEAGIPHRPMLLQRVAD